MCGIIGKIGVGNVFPELLNGLKNLEYRGYDSSGIAIFCDGKISRYRAAGKISNLERQFAGTVPESYGGIGHTRWATHGNPTEENAHPHISQDGKFAIVHNGIIENSDEIKNTLLPKNTEFFSQTDTEVVVKLLSLLYKNDIITALSETCKTLKGSYALGILCEDFPETVFAVAKDSPLIVVKGEKGCWLASDLCAIGEKTSEVYRLTDGEMCALTRNTLTFFNPSGEKIEKFPESAETDCSILDKGDFEHYMQKEIFEQPNAVKNTILSFVKSGEIAFENVNLDEKYIINKLKNIVIVACGSAYHAGISGKYIIEKLCKIPCSVEIASEFRYSEPLITENTLAIFISQSGETADTLAALRLAKNKGAKILSIVNVKGSVIAEESENIIFTKAGREIAVATTKAYSAQLVSIYGLALFIGDTKGTLEKEKYRKLVNELLELPEKIEKTLNCTSDKMKEISAKIYKKNDVFFIGRLSDYATAAEGSLKMKEISYINSQAYPAGELKHGTISLVSDGTPVIAIAGNNKVFSKTVSNISEVRARSARVILITDESEKDTVIDVDDIVKVPETLPEFRSSLLVLPLQLLSYYTAKLLGCDIDKPRNLAKSVTVE